MNGILCADMDNTIIYSYKRNIGENKLNVELYNLNEKLNSGFGPNARVNSI